MSENWDQLKRGYDEATRRAWEREGIGEPPAPKPDLTARAALDIESEDTQQAVHDCIREAFLGGFDAACNHVRTCNMRGHERIQAQVLAGLDKIREGL
jgi:hypothetical protein